MKSIRCRVGKAKCAHRGSAARRRREKHAFAYPTEGVRYRSHFGHARLAQREIAKSARDQCGRRSSQPGKVARSMADCTALRVLLSCKASSKGAVAPERRISVCGS